MKCIKGYEIEVLSSGAGYYIGVFDDEVGPVCRISRDYYKNRKIAEEVFKARSWTSRDCLENNLCNGGKGCQLR
jgi:hypothetical protein